MEPRRSLSDEKGHHASKPALPAPHPNEGPVFYIPVVLAHSGVLMFASVPPCVRAWMRACVYAHDSFLLPSFSGFWDPTPVAWFV